MKTLKIKSRWRDKEYNIAFRLGNYENGNLAILMECYKDDGTYDGAFAKLTVNLGLELMEGYGFLDVGDLGDEIVSWVIDNGLGEDTGYREKTDFVIYPLFKFNMDKIKEYSRS